MGAARGETERHRDLKRRALIWAQGHGFSACGVEVRVPRSGFRADVAACKSPDRQAAGPGETAIFECKQARSDLLRDVAEEVDVLTRLRVVTARRGELEQMLGIHCPSLRRGVSLFAECDEYDFDTIRHDGLRAVRREQAALNAKLFGGTKFDRLRRYRCADRLYLVAAPDVIVAHETPDGWGLLVAHGDELEQVRRPVRLESTADVRLGLLHAIAVAGTRGANAAAGVQSGDIDALRRQVVPD
jgi:hypothetical protein